MNPTLTLQILADEQRQLRERANRPRPRAQRRGIFGRSRS